MDLFNYWEIEMKNKIFILVIVLLFIVSFCGCTDEYDPREKLSLVLGGFFVSNISDDQISEFGRAVDYLGKNDRIKSLGILNDLLIEIDGVSLDEVVVDSPQFDSTYYRGIYCNDVCDCRCVLSNIKNIIEDGFDTIWIEVQLMVHENGTFYVPGEKIYVFYLNAFHASGFRVWLSMGHASYSFPYRWDKKPSNSYPLLSSQKEAMSLAEPRILDWTKVAEKYGIDTFIPEEEANTLLLEHGVEKTNLNQSNRDFLNNWSQDILVKMKQNFSGRFGFATNDGGPLEQFEDREKYPFPQGPDFDYRGFNFIVTKIPFVNSFASDEEWFFELDNRLQSCENYSYRDNTEGIIWYEAGMPVGESYDSNVLNHYIRDEEDQIFAINKTFEYANKYNISGIFFKPSPKQAHEGNWSFFNKPAEQIIRNNFGENNIIDYRRLDDLWKGLGEDGLKVIQLSISDEMPFDPEYELDLAFFNGEYHKLEKNVKG